MSDGFFDKVNQRVEAWANLPAVRTFIGIKELEELKKNQMPPMRKECPECGGEGVFDKPLPNHEVEFSAECDTCDGEGKVLIYYTVKQLKKMGFMFNDKSVVYAYHDGSKVESGWYRKDLWMMWKDSHKDSCISLFPGQPAPPADYRP